MSDSIRDLQRQFFAKTEYAHFSELSGLAPVAKYSLADHKSAYLKTVTPGIGSVKDMEATFYRANSGLATPNKFSAVDNEIAYYQSQIVPNIKDQNILKSANANLGTLRVFQQAPPPSSDAVTTSYLHWPLTDAATTQDFSNSTWSGNIWAFVWCNRYNFGGWNDRPNPLPAPTVFVGNLECRSIFSTIAKANAATQCQIRAIVGMTQANYQQPWLDAGGVAGDFITESSWRSNPAVACPDLFTSQLDGITYQVMTDKVLVPGPVLNTSMKLGIVLDYECQDDRSAAITQSFILSLAADIHTAGKLLFVFSNPYNAPTQIHTNMNETNLPTILANVDMLGIMLWSKNSEGDIVASYNNQIAMLGAMTAALYDKLVIDYEIGDPGTTLADATWMHNKLVEAGTSHPNKLMFWRNFAVPHTIPYNEKVNTVCFG